MWCSASLWSVAALSIRSSSQRVAFAHAVSHATVLAEEGPERLYQLKLGLADADVGRRKVTVSSAQNTAEALAAAKRAREAEERGEGEEEEDEEDAPDPKRIKLGGDDDAMEENDSDSDVDAQPLRPHHILHVRDLPQVTDAMLQVLFQQCVAPSQARLSAQVPRLRACRLQRAQARGACPLRDLEGGGCRARGAVRLPARARRSSQRDVLNGLTCTLVVYRIWATRLR